MRPFTIVIFAILTGTAAAVELPEIPVCSIATASTGATCVPTPGTGKKAVSLTLTAQLSQVRIGPYTVATEAFRDAAHASGTYLPPLLQLQPGEDIHLTLVNKLEPPPVPLGMTEATLDPAHPNDHLHDHTMPLAASDLNVHTHGLIVSPRNGGGASGSSLTKGNGDNIFVTVPPAQSFDYDIDLPTHLDLQNGTQVEHPEGLFWYHPHIHGLAQRQISAGLAGPMAIGNPIRFLRRFNDVGIPFTDDALIKNIDARTIVLKDILVAADKTPDELGNQTGTADWIGLKQASGASTYPDKWTAGFLPTTCDEAPAGWCVPGASFPLPANFARKIVWMFTANGALDPDITIASGHYLLLRIVNESPSVSYDLRFGAYPNGGAKFYVVGLDGAVPGDVPAQTAALDKLRVLSLRNAPIRLAQRSSLLLLPASRAEILIGGSQDSANLTMSTHHVSMGAEPGDADEWPSAKLAELHFSGANVLPPDIGFAPQLHMPADLPVAGNAPATPKGCSQIVLQNTAAKQQWRRIRLASNDTLFFIKSSVVTRQGGKETETDQTEYRTMPMMGTEAAWANTPHVCVRQGQTEMWEIVNETNEFHNFHLHQSKFKLAAQPDDPNGNLAQYPIFNQGDATDLNVWHDTFPIPPAKTTNGTPDPAQPGRVFLAINFGAAQQVGRFVFHCHILEHEDKGMMAPIEVVAAK